MCEGRRVAQERPAQREPELQEETMMEKKLSEKDLKKVIGGAMARGEKKELPKHGGKRPGHAGHVTDKPRDAGSRPVSWTL